MIDSDLIDVESLDLSDEQTWLYAIPDDSGLKVDIVEWNLSFDFPEDNEYLKLENDLYEVLDNILKNDVLSMPDKHKFDSRTYVRPKKRVLRPSIQSIVEVSSNPPSLTSALGTGNKYLTYNKYNAPVSPMIRLKTFNLDTNTENSGPVKDYALKRRSLIQDDDTQPDDLSLNKTLEANDRLSEQPPSKPITIDYSQPAHNIHNTFNRGVMSSDRGSFNMYRSGDSLMRMSPPSLVSSLLMETSGNFNNPESMPSYRDSGIPTSARESIDPMMTSMTLSILDEKDMSTSFLSQTTYPDNDSLMDSLPPSLVSSVNSSYIVSNTTKPRESLNVESNIFSSATFTHLEQSGKLLSARPRHQMFNSFTKRDSLKSSESYTKSREEACQIEPPKVLNENYAKNESPKTITPDMTETVTIHFSNNKFKMDSDAEKENLNSTFKKDDTFYKDMGLQKPDSAKNSFDVTLDKQELNEIIQARQKLSLARKGLPNEPEKQATTSPRTDKPTNQTICMPKPNENASELLSKRRSMNINNVLATNGYEKQEEVVNRETPKRNSTFRKVSPKNNAMGNTVVYVQEDNNQMIDINSATLSLIDSQEKNSANEEWGLQEHAMVGSNESTDTGTFSSSSPPESVPDSTPAQPRASVASTPLMSLRKGFQKDFIALHSTISPIYDVVDDKSYTITKVPSATIDRTYDQNVTVINSNTIVRKSAAKRDILAGRISPEKKNVFGPTVPNKPLMVNRVLSPTSTGVNLPPPTQVPRKTNLPTSKLRQYSSHKELSRIPGGPQSALPRAQTGSRTMLRRNVYASNPALSPTSSGPVRQDSYIIRKSEEPPVAEPRPALVRQGTETLRRERPASQIIPPKERNTSAAPSGYSGIAVMRNHNVVPPSTARPVSIAGVSQLKMPRPVSASGPINYHRSIPVSSSERGAPPAPAARPSRLPAPRRALRPPSVYSVAPTTTDVDHY